MRVHYGIVIFGLLLACLVCSPVSAWSNSLNNNDIPLYVYPGTVTIAYVSHPYTDTVRVETTGTGVVVFPNGSATSNYIAYDNEYVSSSGQFVLFGAGGAAIAAYTTGGPIGRYEVLRIGTNLYVYKDGALYATVPGTPTTAITSFGAGGTGGATPYSEIDDPSFGNAQSDTCIVSVMPHNWYILHNYLNANNYGQYDSSNNLISTTDMHIKWSIGAYNDGWSIASPPDTRYTIKVQAPSGVIAYNEYVDITTAAHAYGYITLGQNKTHIGEQPFEYGTYFVTLYDGTSVRSTDYFQVLAASGTGTYVTWDRTMYTSSDTASVNYGIDAAYWDTGTYSYKLSIKNVYGVEIASYPLTTSTGTVSVPLSGYTQGVHYGQIIITQISAPTNIGVLASSPMEITAYDVFHGYVMNAETGATLYNATVDISQSLLSDSLRTNANGFYISDANWLVGSATTFATSLTGYTSDSLSFTPIASSNITVNISLMPDPATTVGISIGGIVRDKTYHNPVVGAAYTVQNSSLSDYHTATTNIAGFARIDSLTQNRLYDVWSSKTGFSNSTVVQQGALGS